MPGGVNPGAFGGEGSVLREIHEQEIALRTATGLRPNVVELDAAAYQRFLAEWTEQGRRMGLSVGVADYHLTVRLRVLATRPIAVLHESFEPRESYPGRPTDVTLDRSERPPFTRRKEAP